MSWGVARYRLGPFLFGSEIPIPELTAVGREEPREPNAWIRLGTNPERIENVVAHETQWWASKREYLQRVAGVGTFLVKDGREIVVEPALGVPPGDVRAYLLAPIFGQLCFQAGLYAIHASSVQVGDGVVAFSGQSGAGKSTLAAELERCGFPAVSDDMCLLEIGSGDDSGIRVTPVAPALKLWPSALEHLGASPAGLPQVWSREEKFRMRVRENGVRLPLRRIFFLDWEEEPDSAPVVRSQQGVEAISRLMGCMHFEYLMKATGRQAECFRLCGRILEQAPASVLRRPRNFAQMNRVVELVQEHLREDVV